MKVNFISRSQMVRSVLGGIVQKDVSIISISDTEEERDEMKHLLSELENDSICLFFADDEESFTIHQANTILSFISKRQTNFLVHCFAGISRSGAVAKFINEYYDSGIWYLEDYKGYNRHVFNMLHKAAGTSLAAYYEELERSERTHGWS